MKLWEKGYALDRLIEEFTVGNDHIIDRELIAHDCNASIAHARMLEKAGILTNGEMLKLVSELKEIHDKADSLEIPREMEDCHSYIEFLLTEKLGNLGKKIHTARSRNDQVLTALRLYYKQKLQAISDGLLNLTADLDKFVSSYGHIVFPGYTHMRKAMPSSISLWAGAFRDSAIDNREFLESTRKLIDQCPAGTGAGYGIPIEIDREYIARELGFSRVQENAVYVQLSRGKFEAAIIHTVSQIMYDFNRLSSDLIIFSMPEFGYFSIPKKFCTGSSIMPQKKNPDLLELLRCKYHEVMSLCTMVSNMGASLPTGYNRDMQLTKEPVMKAIDICLSCIAIVCHLLTGLEVDHEKCSQGLTDELFATHKAYELVKDGIPFREAYKRIAKELDSTE